MKSSPGGYSKQCPLALQAMCLQPSGDGACLTIQFGVGDRKLFYFSIDQVGEGQIVGLMGGQMPQQVYQVRGAKERSASLIKHC